MTAAMSAALGSALPPARGSQGGISAVRAGGHRVGDGPLERSTGWAATRTGATSRQLDYWGRRGLLGDDHRSIGSGKRRRYSDVDLEVIVALRHLATLGATEHWLERGAAAVRARRVASGEWLMVLLDGETYRRGLSELAVHVDGPGWLVPLTAFDQGRPL